MFGGERLGPASNPVQTINWFGPCCPCCSSSAQRAVVGWWAALKALHTNRFPAHAMPSQPAPPFFQFWCLSGHPSALALHPRPAQGPSAQAHSCHPAVQPTQLLQMPDHQPHCPALAACVRAFLTFGAWCRGGPICHAGPLFPLALMLALENQALGPWSLKTYVSAPTQRCAQVLHQPPGLCAAAWQSRSTVMLACDPVLARHMSFCPRSCFPGLPAPRRLIFKSVPGLETRFKETGGRTVSF